jgi:hypothetical protein
VAQPLRRHGDLARQQQRHAVAELAEFGGLEPQRTNLQSDKETRSTRRVSGSFAASI